MGAALDRLKARLREKRDSQSRLPSHLTELTKPSCGVLKAGEAQPEVSSVSSVSEAGGHDSKSRHPAGAARGGLTPELMEPSLREIYPAPGDAQSALTPLTDNTDINPAEPRAGSTNGPTPGTDRTDKSAFPKKQLMSQLNPQCGFNAAYLAEFCPAPGTPAAPCQCGDRVFYKLAERSPWRCRTCEPLNAHLKVLWFVSPPGGNK